VEESKSRQNQRNSDPSIDLREYMSLGVTKIPEVLHPVKPGWTRASSFAALTGCDPCSGAIGSTASLTAISPGVGNRYYLETIIMTEPGFEFMWRHGRLMATYPGSWAKAWKARRERIEREQLERAGAAAEHLRTDCSSGCNHRGNHGVAQ
jgi:hypothetical protein